MAIVETMNMCGAIVRVHDDYIRSREESEEIMQRVADIILRQLNIQHNARRVKEMQE
jgi:hypothetical protein